MTGAIEIGRLLFVTGAVWLLSASPGWCQNWVLITCPDASRCVYQRATAAQISGQDSVRLLPFSPEGDSRRQRGGRSAKISTLSGLYRQPDSGLLRILSRSGELGELVAPSRSPREAASPGDVFPWTIDFREPSGAKVVLSAPHSQFVALIREPSVEAGVVEFLKGEMQTRSPHPMRQQMLTGAAAFLGTSPELRKWAEELEARMDQNLKLFKAEQADPRLLEAILAEGIAATKTYRALSPDVPVAAIEIELNREYAQLLERFAMAGALKNAGMAAAFLDKLDQIGLARWSRPELMSGIEEQVRVATEARADKARHLLAAGYYAKAFDEARLASVRNPCDEAIHTLYYETRIQLVNQKKIPMLSAYDSKDRILLEQIVRELDTTGGVLTRERVARVIDRVSEGERMDKDYLPLQLKKAEFLFELGRLTEVGDVVARTARHLPLGKKEAEEWLALDAKLNGALLAQRRDAQGLLKEHFDNANFREALTLAANGLRAEPANSSFLYQAAIAAAVLRDQAQSRRLIERYLRSAGSSCPGAEANRNLLLSLYRRLQPESPPLQANERSLPNWISGALYVPGEAYYDPISGSFNGRVFTSVASNGRERTETEFRWAGYLAGGIVTTKGGTRSLERRPLLELEPVYDAKHAYMKGVALRTGSSGAPTLTTLRYRNSPDFDPILAREFTSNVNTQGWAGNPFFHPFIWEDIYVFDLKYDELGRLVEAVPVPPDFTRTSSRFSERLAFTWEGSSQRLREIKGNNYRREMVYDKRGRLTFELIKHSMGSGKIEYIYNGDSMRPIRVECEDNFFDRGRRTVLFATDLYR